MPAFRLVPDTNYAAVVAPYSPDNEHDAMIFASFSAAERWLRSHLDAYGRPQPSTYVRSDGTADSGSLGWPCFRDSLRDGFGYYAVRFLGWDSDRQPIWVGFDYTAGVWTLGTRGGLAFSGQ
jgi:hypothetical protein